MLPRPRCAPWGSIVVLGPGGSAAGLERYQPAACSPPGRPRAPQNGTRRVGHSPSSPARRSSVRRIPRSTASIRNDRRDRGAARLQRLDRGALAGPLRRAWLRRAARRAAPGQAALDRRRGRRAGDRQTLEEQPSNATHWSTRSMARATGMSQTAVSRIWRAFGLKPHQTEAFELSPDPRFIDKVRDIVGLYLNPPDAAVVLCVDGSPRSTRSIARRRCCRCCPGCPSATPTTTSATPPRTSTPRARRRLRPGHHRHDPAPSRRGVASLPQSDRALGAGAPRRSRRARQLLDPQDPGDPALAAAPPALHAALHADLQLVAEPRRALVRRADDEVDQALGPSLGARPRCLDPTWITNRNEDPEPYVWHKTADKILDSLASHCQRISDSDH
jgi:hypothetical protein